MNDSLIKLNELIELNVRDTKSDRETILFLHFGGGTLEMWNGIIPYFKDNFRLVMPDLRGHGKSSKPEKGYHIDDMAEDIYLLLKELDISKCHIVGSSLGAEVAINFASSHPNMVSSIVCEGAFYNEYGEYGLINKSMEEIEEDKQKRLIKVNERKQEFYNSRSEMKEEMLEMFRQEGFDNEYFEKYIESTICETDDGVFTNCFAPQARKEYTIHYWDFKFEKYYKNIICPVLFLPSNSEWKDEIVMNIIHKFSSFLKDSEINHIEGSEHVVLWMQTPEKAAKVVNNFIARY